MPTDFEKTVQEGPGSIEDVGVGKFGAKLVTFPNKVKGILKYKAFATDKFRGVPKAEMPKREVAAYRLDRDLLKFNMVPETLLVRLNGKEASIQKFEEGFEARALVPGIFDKAKEDWKYKVAKLFTMVNTDDLMRLVIFDMIINNSDRHARNIIIDTANNRIWAIDNGLSFGPYYYKYRDIFHKYMLLKTFPVPDEIIRLLLSISEEDVALCLGDLVGEDEIQQTFYRMKFILDHQDHLDFMSVSQGQLDRNCFPSYEKWFKHEMAPDPEIPLILDMNQFPGWDGASP